MDIFLKTTAGILITLILYLILSKRNKEFAGILSVVACCMVILGAVTYLDPLVSFIRQLKNISNMNSELMEVLLKSVGITLLAQIVTLICEDGGNTALGKAIQILASSIILWLTLPLLNTLLELIGKVIDNT